MRIQRLNMDNSWWIEFAERKILIDPWLQGVEIDFFSWFNTQWHKTQPIAPNNIPDFDIVLITQKYPDHFHPETLLEINPKQIIVPASLEKKTKKLLPKAEVLIFDKGLCNVFNSSINLHFLPTSRKIDPIYDAIILEDKKESILIATHGYTEISDWESYLTKLPPVKLAFTPFNKYKLPFFLGGTVAPGMEAVEKMIQIANPEKIVATHDEDKHAKGLVHKFAKITFAPSDNKLIKNPILTQKYLPIKDYKTYTI